MPAATSTKLTYEDYLLLPDDGRRHEIIDGEHYVNPAPNTKHQRILLRLAIALHNHVDPRKLGEIFIAPYDVVMSRFDVLQPDILFITAEHAELITTKNLQGTPDLVIEILSPSNRQHDEILKRKRYDRFGVAEYWIVDPDNDAITVFRRGASTLECVVRAATEGTITSPLLPEFTLDVGDVFA